MKRFRELSFVTPNRPGALNDILKAIAREDINIPAINSAPGFDWNVVRLVTDDARKARAIIEQRGCSVAEETVLGVALADRPGQLASLSGALGNANINIDYLYAAAGGHDHEAMVICHVSNLDNAERVLKEAGIEALVATA